MSKIVYLLVSLMIILRHNQLDVLPSVLVKILRETQGRLTILKGRTLNKYYDGWT